MLGRVALRPGALSGARALLVLHIIYKGLKLSSTIELGRVKQSQAERKKPFKV